MTAGTVFQDSRLPLTLWFRAAWWGTTQKNGGSAMGLQRVLGLKSYKTAWSMLHKLRHAMVRRGGIYIRRSFSTVWAAIGVRTSSSGFVALYSHSGYLRSCNPRRSTAVAPNGRQGYVLYCP